MQHVLVAMSGMQAGTGTWNGPAPKGYLEPGKTPEQVPPATCLSCLYMTAVCRIADAHQPHFKAFLNLWDSAS